MGAAEGGGCFRVLVAAAAAAAAAAQGRGAGLDSDARAAAEVVLVLAARQRRKGCGAMRDVGESRAGQGKKVRKRAAEPQSYSVLDWAVRY